MSLTLVFLSLWGIPSASASANCSEASFRLAQHFDTAAAPQSLVAADFNGDGRPDIASTGAADVEVRLNDGAGWFGRRTNFTTADASGALDAGDFNGDGRTDLLVGHPNAGRVSLLRGDGAGGFGPPVQFALGQRTLAVVAADFNGDGKLDAAVGYLLSDESGVVSVLLGDGAGGLSPAGAAAQVNGTPRSLVPADFDKDGRLDLALATNRNTLILAGDGAGGFGAPLADVTGATRHVASADFNADGNADLAVAARDEAVTLLLGDGVGGFNAPTLAATGPNSILLHVAAADFDGDGKQDLAVVLRGWSSAAVLRGDGAGGFGAPRTFGAGVAPSALAAADFDGDGTRDLAVSTGLAVVGSTTGFVVLLGAGAGDFRAAPTLPVNTTPIVFTPRRGPGRIALADFNGDGKTDIATSNGRNVGIVGGSPTVSVLLADGAGGFNAVPEIKFPLEAEIGSLVAADFNRDGKGDLALVILQDFAGHVHTVGIYLGNGAGGFTAHRFVSVAMPNDIEVVDFDNDSNPDLLVKKAGNFIALIGDGTGNFRTLEGSSGGSAFSDITVGDFNNDGRPDLAITDGENGKVYVALGAGNGDFGFLRHITVGEVPLALAPADFNGDGKLDLAVTRAPNSADGFVTILLGDGTGLFGPPVSYEVGPQPAAVTAGDFNGDGFADIATAAPFSPGVSVLTGNGDGTFRPRVGFVTDSGLAHMVAHDFNADGKVDLGAAQTDAHTVALLLNNMTEPLPCLSFGDAAFAEGNAGEREAEFDVTLSEASDKTVKVNYYFGGFPATGGQDFKGEAGSLVFPPGTTSLKLKVAIVGDAVDEDDESFRVTLRSPLNALIGDGEALGNILDDDEAPGISVGDAAAAEGNSSGSSSVPFAITLSAPSAKPITVRYSTSPGTATQTATTGDYFAASGTLEFAPGQTTRNVNVTIRGDNVRESDETFTLSLSDPTNAAVIDGTAQGIIFNDDPVPVLSITNASTAEASPAGGVTVRVRLSNPTDQTVTVEYATADATATAGSDYVAASGALTFNPGEVEKSFVFAVVNDAEDERNETFTVSLSNPANATTAPAPGVFMIIDDDGPSISVNDVSVTEGDAGPKLAIFTLSLSAPSPQSVMVRVSTSDGTANGTLFSGDFLGFSNRSVSFAEGATTATFSVQITGDQIIEPDETFFVNLSQPQDATLADAQGVGTILNDDTTSVRFSADAVSASEAAGAVQLTVTRIGDLSGVFTAAYVTSDGTASARADYTAAAGTLRFGPNETTKTITVFLTDDAHVEAPENFFVLLSGAAGGQTDLPSSITVTVSSDDAAPGPNPIDDTTFFVRQHYRDFLGRDPDAAGLAFWVDGIESCGADQP